MKMVPTAVLVLLLSAVAVATAPGVAVAPALWVAGVTPALVASDLRELRLPNALTLPGVLVVAVSTTVAFGGVGPGAQAATVTLGATIFTAALGWLASRRRAFGLGDVKLSVLLVGSLALVDPALLLPFALASGAAGFLAALITLRMGCRSRGSLSRPLSAAGSITSWRAARIAFGPCLLLGYWVALGCQLSRGGSC